LREGVEGIELSFTWDWPSTPEERERDHNFVQETELRTLLAGRGVCGLEGPLSAAPGVSPAVVQAVVDEVVEKDLAWKYRPFGLLFRRADLGELPPVEAPSGYEIRGIRPGEEFSAGVCLSEAFGEEWSEERVKSELSENAFVDRMLVAVKGGEVAATASAASSEEWGRAGYVHYVAVHPSHQGLSLGYWISLAVLHEFLALGRAAAVLHTDDHRLPAIKTYLKLGFALDDSANPGFASRWEVISRKLGRH
jgi:mycothiol synthase